MVQKQIMMVDPPGGWQYGYPKEYPGNETRYRQQLRESKYPEDQIDFAAQHSRYWVKDV